MRFRHVLLIAAGAALLPTAAAAQSVRLIGDFRDWSAYSAAETDGGLCFALSKPTEVTPQPTDYTQAYLYLTHRPADRVSNEINLVAGFSFAPDTSATLSVGGKSFELFTKDDAAWLSDAKLNDDLAGVMRAGTTLIVQGTASDGTEVYETFSLSGATAASRAISGDC